MRSATTAVIGPPGARRRVRRARGCDVAGKVVVLSATVDPAGSLALGEALAATGAEYVDAPVAGSAAQARERALVVLASAAERAVVDRLEPLFAAIDGARRTFARASDAGLGDLDAMAILKILG